MKTILLAALLCCSAAAIAQPDAYRIVYNVHLPDTSRDDWEIFSMRTDGSGKQNITQNPDVAWAYYAYGDKLYFISDRDNCYRCFYLYESDAQGKNIRKVSDLQLEDSWISSRNQGREMVVAGRQGKDIRYQLFLIDITTGSYSQLTHDTAARYSDPCFSPDGEQIAFAYKARKRDKSTHDEIYLMNSDGSGLRQLSHYPADNPSYKTYGYKAGATRWHPSGAFISYLSKQDGRHSIFGITPDGKKQWKLTDNTLAEGWHDWSPDGQWLVFNSSDIEETQFHISLMNWETKKQQQLTDNSFKSQQAPVFIRSAEK